MEEALRYRIQKDVSFVNETLKNFLLKIEDKPKATRGHHNHTIVEEAVLAKNVVSLTRNTVMCSLLMMVDQRSTKSTDELRAILLTVNNVLVTLQIILLLI